MNGIRRQLLVLVAGALLPLIAFVAWTLYQQHLDTRSYLREEAHDQATLLRNAIDGHLGLSEAVLASLTPLALRGGGSISRDDLESVMRHLPSYATNVLAFDRMGALVTAYRPLEHVVSERVGGRSYLDEAMRSPGVAIFQPSVGRATGNRMIKSALAYRDRDGTVAGVLVMTTDVAMLEAQLLDPLVERHLNVAVVTPDGGTVMRSKGSASIDPTIPLLREAIAQPDFEGEIEGDKAFSFASARTARAPLAVVVFADRELELGEHKRHGIMLAAAFLALGLGLICALFISRRISRPLFALSRAAENLGNGDLRYRVPMLEGEAGRVGRAFNAMAEQLEAQRTTIRAEAERFRVVFENCPLAVAICDLETGALVEVNAAFRDITGKAANDLIGKTTLQIDLWVDPAQRATAMHLAKTQGRLEAFECKQRVRDGKIADYLLFSEVMEMGGRRMLLSQGVDVTELKRAERQLREVSKRLKLATRSARIGVWDLDLRSRQLAWDDTMFDLFRASPQDFGGRFDDWLRFVPSGERSDLERCRLESLGAHNELDIQYRALLSDGSMRHMRSSASVERDERGVPVRLMGTTLDVTENVLGREALARVNSELEARVVERTGELQETVRELEAFSYTVAHDLRAPLRAIDGFSSHLRHTLGGEEAAETAALLGKIRRNVGSMDRLIDGLLNYARLGRQAFTPVPVDMTQIAKAARAELASAYPDVQITIDALPGTLGDPEMLGQVWINLIGNACKFSRSQPQPRVAVGSTSHPEGTVYFVWDNGVGFDMRYSDRLFRVFERLHTDPEFGGTGVGLAIVQRIMQRHAGDVWAESIPGEGATFYFRLTDRPDSAG